MTAEPFLKPVIWVGSSRQNLRAFPEQIQDHMGYALYVAQIGGRHRDAKTMSGFGGAGVVEVISDYRGDTFRTVYTLRFFRCRICPPRVSEEIEARARDAAPGHGTDQAAVA